MSTQILALLKNIKMIKIMIIEQIEERSLITKNKKWPPNTQVSACKPGHVLKYLITRLIMSLKKRLHVIRKRGSKQNVPFSCCIPTAPEWQSLRSHEALHAGGW